MGKLIKLFKNLFAEEHIVVKNCKNSRIVINGKVMFDDTNKTTDFLKQSFSVTPEKILNRKMKILKFGNERCAPCRALNEFLKDNTPPNVEIISVTRETHPRWFEKYGVKSIPLLIQIDENDEEVKRWRGSTFMFLIETARKANKEFK